MYVCGITMPWNLSSVYVVCDVHTKAKHSKKEKYELYFTGTLSTLYSNIIAVTTGSIRPVPTYT